MKTRFLTILFAMLLALSSVAGPVITIKFDIGKRSQPNCPGFGWCTGSITIGWTDGAVNGTLQADETKGSIVIGIYEKDILKYQPDKIVYFKGKGSVIFTEDVILPKEFNTAAKTTRPLVIKKGEYPLTYLKGMYYIEIPF